MVALDARVVGQLGDRYLVATGGLDAVVVDLAERQLVLGPFRLLLGLLDWDPFDGDRDIAALVLEQLDVLPSVVAREHGDPWRE